MVFPVASVAVPREHCGLAGTAQTAEHLLVKQPSIDRARGHAYSLRMPNRAGPWPTAAGRTFSSQWSTYAIALGAGAMSVALQALLYPTLHERTVLLAFGPVMLAGAAVSGAAAALAITVRLDPGVVSPVSRFGSHQRIVAPACHQSGVVLAADP